MHSIARSGGSLAGRFGNAWRAVVLFTTSQCANWVGRFKTGHFSHPAESYAGTSHEPADRLGGRIGKFGRDCDAAQAAEPLRPYREITLAKVQEELSAIRIWQDLANSGASVGYDSVW